MNKKWLIIGMLAVSFIVSGCMNNGKTNAIYLIPEGYTGYAMAFYNVKNAPPLTYEGDFAVHQITEEGYFVTSKNDMTYGTVTDQYYYVDENGKRSPIDDQCISTMGTGGYESYGEGQGPQVDIHYTGIDITDDCSAEFANAGNGIDSEREQPILDRVLEEYYLIIK